MKSFLIGLGIFLLTVFINPAPAQCNDGSKPVTFSKPNPEAAQAAPYWTRGLAAFKNGDYEQAVLELSKKIELMPGSTITLLLRGHAYYKQGKYDQAIADFKNVLEIQNGNEYFAYANLATVYLKTKNYEKAWESLHKAKETLGEVNEAGAINFVLIKPYKELSEELKKVSKE